MPTSPPERDPAVFELQPHRNPVDRTAPAHPPAATYQQPRSNGNADGSAPTSGGDTSADRTLDEPDTEDLAPTGPATTGPAAGEGSDDGHEDVQTQDGRDHDGGDEVQGDEDRGDEDTGDEDAAATPIATPAEYLAELAGLHQVVLVGDRPGVRQHLEVIVEAIPLLAAAGVRHLAWEFTNSRAQAALDTLLTAPDWDDRACADLFVDLLGVGFAYREYADVLHAVWEHNRSQSAEVPFRVIALGVPSYVEDPDLLDGRSAGELELRNWWLGGHYRDISAFHMANVLTSEVIRHGERAVVYADVSRTTTRLVEWQDGLPTTTLGNLLHRWMGEGVQRVVFHGAIADPGAMERVEQLIAAAPEDVVELGIDLELSTLGNVGLTDVVGSIDGDKQSFRLQDVADGYLYRAPRDSWTPCSLIEDLITPQNFVDVEARYRALDPREERYTLAELEEVRREGLDQLEAGWVSLPEVEEPEPKKRRFRRR